VEEAGEQKRGSVIEEVAESLPARDSAQQPASGEQEASSELARLSDERFRECENALKLQKSRADQERDKKTADEKAEQQRITNKYVACLLRYLAIIVFLWFIGALILLSIDLLIVPFLSEKAQSRLWPFVTLGFGMAVTKIFDKFFPK